MTDAPLREVAGEEIQRLQRAVAELTLLNELALAIGRTTDLDEIISLIVTRATDAVRAREVVLTLVDRTAMTPAGTIFRKASSDQDQHFHLTRNLIGCMWHERRALMINDAPNDARLRDVPLPPGVRNLICVPLTVGPELIAVMSACNKCDGGDFLPDDQRLLAIMASQSAQVLEQARLRRDEAANAQLRADLLVAKSIQTCLLPTSAPRISGYDAAGVSVPARQVGGDYFDFIPLPDENMGIVLADVSGKGIPAALLMSNLQAMLRGQAPREISCHRFVHWCNKQFFRCTPLSKFATLFYGVLDPARNLLTYCNAGHERPFLLSEDKPPRRLLTGGLALGILAEAEYQAETIPLRQGDRLVAFSDGVTDVVNDRDEPFGEERLLDVLESGAALSAEQVVATVKEAVTAHAGGQPAFDDLTLVVVKRC